MIVMKFGGTSVADAERLRRVAQLVAARAAARPVVVVSALAGVTDLLLRAMDHARTGDLDGLDPLLAELERRHRWAVAGAIGQAERRHRLSLLAGGLFEELRRQLRSMRILGEASPRAADAVLAFGEELSSRIAAATLEDAGLRARWFDARQVMITDARHGAAAPDLDAVAARAAERLAPLLAAGEIPLLGGFVGATAGGETTTLGRGGSDTSAAVLGLALGAREIQIWTDVDGMMTADPRRLPAARRLDELSFAEAAEFAAFGARVLHPASIAPAVRREIPVRVLNTLSPDGPGTRIVAEVAPAAGPAGIVSRTGVSVLRASDRTMRAGAAFRTALGERAAASGIVPELTLGSPTATALVLRSAEEGQRLEEELAPLAALSRLDGRGVIAVIGAALGRDAALRAAVLGELARFRPDLVAAGASPASLAAVVEEAALGQALRALHARFLERVDEGAA